MRKNINQFEHQLIFSRSNKDERQSPYSHTRIRQIATQMGGDNAKKLEAQVNSDILRTK